MNMKLSESHENSHMKKDNVNNPSRRTYAINVSCKYCKSQTRERSLYMQVRNMSGFIIPNLS